MLASPPPDDHINNFDLSLLSKRIAEVKDASATMSQKELAKYFIKNSILTVLNTPQIYQMLQNEKFVEEFTNLLLGFLVTAPKVAPKANEL